MDYLRLAVLFLLPTVVLEPSKKSFQDVCNSAQYLTKLNAPVFLSHAGHCRCIFPIKP
jgi:hypothetical protein